MFLKILWLIISALTKTIRLIAKAMWLIFLVIILVSMVLYFILSIIGATQYFIPIIALFISGVWLTNFLKKIIPPKMAIVKTKKREKSANKELKKMENTIQKDERQKERMRR
jgi:hypothetical protein